MVYKYTWFSREWKLVSDLLQYLSYQSFLFPNTERIRPSEHREVNVWSIKPIKAGEEVRVNYAPGMKYEITSERNVYLRSRLSFSCNCPACADPIISPKSDETKNDEAGLGASDNEGVERVQEI